MLFVLQEFVQNVEDVGVSEVKFFYDKYSYVIVCLFDEEFVQFQVQLSFKVNLIFQVCYYFICIICLMNIVIKWK